MIYKLRKSFFQTKNTFGKISFYEYLTENCYLNISYVCEIALKKMHAILVFCYLKHLHSFIQYQHGGPDVVQVYVIIYIVTPALGIKL